jgi:hypothetical protein
VPVTAARTARISARAAVATATSGASSRSRLVLVRSSERVSSALQPPTSPAIPAVPAASTVRRDITVPVTAPSTADARPGLEESTTDES